VSRFWGTFVNVPVLGFLALLALAVPVFAADAPGGTAAPNGGAAPALSGGTEAPAPAAPFAASPGGTPVLPPGVTPQQAEAAKQMLQSGAPLPPGAQKYLESHPELKDQLPPDLKQKVEEKLAEKGGESPSKPSLPETAPESFGMLPGYDWKTSPYVGRLFLTRL